MDKDKIYDILNGKNLKVLIHEILLSLRKTIKYLHEENIGKFNTDDYSLLILNHMVSVIRNIIEDDFLYIDFLMDSKQTNQFKKKFIEHLIKIIKKFFLSGIEEHESFQEFIRGKNETIN